MTDRSLTENEQFLEVAEDVFFHAIGPLNVSPRVTGRYGEPDYGSDFVTPHGEVMGQIVDNCLHDGAPNHYYVARKLI